VFAHTKKLDLNCENSRKKRGKTKKKQGGGEGGERNKIGNGMMATPAEGKQANRVNPEVAMGASNE